MMRAPSSLALILLSLAGAARARAGEGDRPSEDELFGATPAPSAPEAQRPSEDELFGATPAPSAPESQRPSEDELFGGPSAPQGDRPSEGDLFGARPSGGSPDDGGQHFGLDADAAPEDPLAIGGLLYLRARAAAREGEALKDVSFSTPNLLDVYFDARVNDRVRGFASFRETYTGLPAESELTLEPVPITTIIDSCGVQVASTSGAASASGDDADICVTTGYGLTQLWLRTDARRRVFFTVGRQFVKWGTGRFWNPTDFLQPVARDPLAPFDVRSGTDMVRLHIPWEAKGWSLYAIALTDRFLLPAEVTTEAEDTPTLGTLSNVGAAARAEIVLGTMELGLDGIWKAASSPRVGADVSAGLGPVDVYAEAALSWGALGTVYEHTGDEDLDGDGDLDAVWEPYEPEGVQPKVTVGLSWSGLLTDTTPLNLGAEAYYNALGYDDPSVYPTLFLNGDYVPFQIGRTYAAVFANLAGPGTWDDASFTLSSIANVSDRSVLTRLDVSWLLHRQLRLEVYAAMHAGNTAGEMHQGIALSIPAPPPFPPIEFSLAPPTWEGGLALRLAI